MRKAIKNERSCWPFQASDNLGVAAMGGVVEKHYLAFPRGMGKEWFGKNDN